MEGGALVSPKDRWIVSLSALFHFFLIIYLISFFLRFSLFLSLSPSTSLLSLIPVSSSFQSLPSRPLQNYKFSSSQMSMICAKWIFTSLQFGRLHNMLFACKMIAQAFKILRLSRIMSCGFATRKRTIERKHLALSLNFRLTLLNCVIGAPREETVNTVNCNQT